MYSKLALMPAWDVFKPIKLQDCDVQSFSVSDMLPILQESWEEVPGVTPEFIVSGIIPYLSKYYGWIDSYRVVICKCFAQCFPEQQPEQQPCSNQDLQELIGVLAEYKTLLVQSRGELWNNLLRTCIQMDTSSQNTIADELLASLKKSDTLWKDEFQNWRRNMIPGISVKREGLLQTNSPQQLNKGYPLCWVTALSDSIQLSNIAVRYRYSWEGGLSFWDADMELAIVTYNLTICSLLDLAMDYEAIGSREMTQQNNTPSVENIVPLADNIPYDDFTNINKGLTYNEDCLNTLNFFKWFDPSIVVPDCWALYGIKADTSSSLSSDALSDANTEFTIAKGLLSNLTHCDGLFNDRTRLTKTTGVTAWSAKIFEVQFKQQQTHLQRVRTKCVDTMGLLEELLYVLGCARDVTLLFVENEEDELSTHRQSQPRSALKELLGEATLAECSVMLKMNREHVTYMSKILEMLSTLIDLDLVRLNSFSKCYGVDMDQQQQQSNGATSETSRKEAGLNYWTYFYAILKLGSDFKLQLDNSLVATLRKYRATSSPIIKESLFINGYQLNSTANPVTKQSQQQLRSLTEELQEEFSLWAGVINKTFEELAKSNKPSVIEGDTKRKLTNEELYVLNQWTRMPNVEGHSSTLAPDVLHQHPYEIMSMGKLASYGQALGSYIQGLFAHFHALQETFVIWNSTGYNNVHEANGLYYYDPKGFAQSKSIALLRGDVRRLYYQENGLKNPHLIFNGRSAEQLRWLLNLTVCVQRILLRHKNINQIQTPCVARITLPAKFAKLISYTPLKLGEPLLKYLPRFIDSALVTILRALQRVITWDNTPQYWRKKKKRTVKVTPAIVDITSSDVTTTQSRGYINPCSSSIRLKNLHERLYNISQFLLGKIWLANGTQNTIGLNSPNVLAIHQLCSKEEIERDIVCLWSTFWLASGGLAQLEREVLPISSPVATAAITGDQYEILLKEEFANLPQKLKHQCLEEVYKRITTKF